MLAFSPLSTYLNDATCCAVARGLMTTVLVIVAFVGVVLGLRHEIGFALLFGLAVLLLAVALLPLAVR